MEQAVEKPIELEYPKAPFGKRFVAFLLDIFLMTFVGLGSFVLLRLAVENSSRYKNAFATYVDISQKSGLYVYKETNDNLVKVSEYYKDQFGEDYIQLDAKLEQVITDFYALDPIDIFDGDEGVNLYRSQKIGESAIKTSGGDYYFKLQGDSIVYNQSEEVMYSFYQEANIKAIEHLSRSESYVDASKVLSKTVNFFLIPASITIALLVFEFLIPLIFFRRGWQTLGMKVLKMSLLNANAVSPRFRTFLFRFLWFWLAEVMLSLVTFAVPAIVSFSMFAFRKDGQCFHDYMTGVYMVDSSQQSIYLSKEEYLKLKEKAAEFETKIYR